MAEQGDASNRILTHRQSIWLYVVLSLLFAGTLHLASDAELLPLWARHGIITVLATVSIVGVIMFGRRDSLADFVASTATIGVWALLAFAAVYFTSAICLYLALIPFLGQIVIDCLDRKGKASTAFIVIWSLWFSTGILFTLLIHGPFHDVALLSHITAIAWYLDLRLVLALTLCAFVIFQALLAAQQAPTRRLIREIELAIEAPQGNGMISEVMRGIIAAVNGLLLRHLTQFTNIVTGFISAMLCYLAATGREIGCFIQEHVLNFPLFGMMLRRIAVFALVLCLALAIPYLANGTLEYVRTTSIFGHVAVPVLDGIIALIVIAIIQLLLPIEFGGYLRRAPLAAFFVVCVLFSSKTIAIGLSYIPDSPLRYARNLDALYLLMVMGVIVASFAGFRPK